MNAWEHGSKTNKSIFIRCYEKFLDSEKKENDLFMMIISNMLMCIG
jgi:hypothetical protein